MVRERRALPRAGRGARALLLAARGGPARRRALRLVDLLRRRDRFISTRGDGRVVET